MPANLTPDYFAAERDYRAATTPADRVAALERMLRMVPKHKGTEKIQADIKKRLSRERRESQRKGGVSHGPPFWQVPKEGAGQVTLVGAPNAGKSRLVEALTNAHVDVAAYPFTTRVPTPGMMPFQDIQIQLLDLPPLCTDMTEFWMAEVLRLADASVLIVDANDPDVLGETEYILGRFEAWKLADPILLVGTKLDLERERENFADLVEIYGDRFPSMGVSAETREGLEQFAATMFDLLRIVRIYTKRRGHRVDLDAPYILHRGQTVEDAAAKVHHDFVDNLRFAKLYDREGKGGLMVERSHVLEDGDVLEFHV